MYSLVQEIGICPDVPHAVNVSKNKTPEGNGVGVLKEPPAGYKDDANNELSPSSLAAKSLPFFITFQQILTNSLTVKWQALFFDKKLYITIPEGGLPEGSKESFVNLLEYTEEILHCKNAIVCFNKNRMDKGCLIKTFMFLGFSLLPPGHQFTLKHSDKIFMSYDI
ncbi:unnamed protein product [Gordionus sp. m RMFG-2023]